MRGPLRINATVAYCTPAMAHLIAVELPPGATLRDAVLASGLLQLAPELEADRLDLGVFGIRRAPNTPLRAGDRVEVYRPLALDPATARRLRAAARRTARR
jgi:putative ubiquitin-RnfH superfamily antitoxin RatB of RatAB toxin-antitoxin module